MQDVWAAGSGGLWSAGWGSTVSTASAGAPESSVRLLRRQGTDVEPTTPLGLPDPILGMDGHGHQAAEGEDDSPGLDLARVNDSLDGIFSAFAGGNREHLSLLELGAGLVMLCEGTKQSNAKSAFELYDRNGDGYVSMDELRTAVESCLRVLVATDTQAAATLHGNSPGRMADEVARSVFRAADKSGDDRLSMREFVGWYRSEGGHLLKKRIVAPRICPPVPLAIHEAREVFGLGFVPAQEACARVQRMAGPDGMVNKDEF